MPSFIDTVKAVADPIFFFPNRELTGTVMADASDNGTDGTYHASAVIGLESPVQTDPLSRSFSGPAKLLIADAPLSDVRGTFSWGFFIYKHTSLSFDDYLAFTRNGQLGVTGGTYAGFNNGTLTAVVHINGVDYQVTVPDADLPRGAWYFAGVSRTGSVLRINVNGFNADTNNTIDPDDLDPGASDGWVFGADGDQNLFLSPGTCSPFLSTSALSDNDWLQIYESARNRLPMFVDISMRTYFIPDLTPPPVYAAFPYTHDFASPLIERLVRSTEVVETKDGGEERSGQSDKTRRRYTYEIPIMDAHSRRRLKALLRKNQKLPIVWPTATDATELTEAVSPGSSVAIPIDTQYMDYDIGGRAILSTSETVFEAIEIEDMDGESVTAKTVQNEWPIGTTLQPAKRAVVQQDISLTSITDDTQDLTLTADLLVEDIATSPNRITPYTPTLYRGVEVFDPFEFGLNDTSEAAEDDSHMMSQVMDTGTGIFRVDYDQEFAKEGIGYTFFLDGRELISRWLGWFEARAGRLNNLWVPTMVSDVGEIVSMSDSPAPHVIINESTYTEDYALHPSRVDICFVQTDDTIIHRHITVAERDGDEETLTVSAGLIGIEDTTEYLCFLLMCRLDADEVELAWFTNDLVKATVKFREIPKEAV
jgi:hypothetical protein